MATDNNRLHLTDQQVLLERVKREVVEHTQDAGFVLSDSSTGGGPMSSSACRNLNPPDRRLPLQIMNGV